MPKATGVFEQFRYLDQIPLNDITKWLGSKVESHSLENFIGNRIIYPHTIPLTKFEMEIDLAIFREGIKRQPEVLYDAQSKKVKITPEFKYRFGTPQRLIQALIESLNFKDVIYITFESLGKEQLVGSIVTPISKPNELLISINIDNQMLSLKAGSINFLPYKNPKINIKFPGDGEMIAVGGEFGLVIDLR